MKKIKMNIKGLKNYITMASVSLVLTFPTFAFAATSPEAKLKGAFNSVTNLIVGVSLAAGGCVLAWYLFNMYFAGESHKKAEIKDSIKTVGVVTATIPMATLLVKWIGNMFM